jgi:hypothetical protein
MSIFEHRKPNDVRHARNLLAILRTTLKKIEANTVQMPHAADLRRILRIRIAELESRQN